MAGEKNWILTLNAGSSSLKFAAYDRSAQNKLASGQIAHIGPDARLVFGDTSQKVDALDHAEALKLALEHMLAQGLGVPPACAGHRVVHGGARTKAAVLDGDVRHDIERASALAPLHNPPALKVMDALNRKIPDLNQVACFDTSFHSANPPEATTIAIPKDLRDEGIRRYGFHGLSYASLVRRFQHVTGMELPQRLLAMHLGAGASLAAIVEGKGVATSMGFSPMDGLVMATRSGSIDPGVLLYLMRTKGMDAAELDDLLNHKSGLGALSGGESDMKRLLERRDEAAEFAVSHFCYWVCRHAGSMIGAMGGVDGVVFTGGIGENAKDIRTRILNSLAWAAKYGGKPATTGGKARAEILDHWVISADEEGEIAHLAARFFG